MFYLLCAIVFLLLPFASFAFGIQSRHSHFIRTNATVTNQQHGRVSTKTIVGNFPTVPSYAIYYQYTDSLCENVLTASSVLLDTCFSSGTISEKFSMGKKSQFSSSFANTKKIFPFQRWYNLSIPPIL